MRLWHGLVLAVCVCAPVAARAQGYSMHVICDSGCSGGGGSGGTVNQGTAGTAPWPVVKWVGGTAVSASNPDFFSVVVGGAVVSVTNPLSVQQVVGGAVLGSSNPMPVQLSGNVTIANRSGTITTGGTAQQAAAGNTSRKTLFIKNPCSATEALYVRVDGSAATMDQNSTDLNACQSAFWPAGSAPSGAVSVIAATTGHAFHMEEGQ